MSTPTPPVPPSPYEPPTASGGALPPGGDESPRLPWEERERLGVVEALIETIRLLVTDPSNAFARLRRDEDLTSPILFAIILGWLAGFLNQMWSFLFASTYRSLLGGLEGWEGLFGEPSLVGLVVTLVVLPIIIVVGLFISSGIMHLCLLMVGATGQSPAGFEGTLKVYAYSQVAGLATVVPVLGSLVYGIWALVLNVVGYAIVHRTTQGKSLLAVLIPVLLCCACGILVLLLFGAVLSGILAGARQL
ncbi:MAG TPA: YIP1 family protein [Vicinamibacteria bacterium]|nr:YIP1 family protein [Vicinamibacteria bacterium]